MQSRCTIKIINLSKKFGEKTIFHDVNYEFYTNNLYGIIGESGNGKTTLLNVLGLIDNKYSGEVFFDGERLIAKKDYHDIRVNKIGFIFQSYYLIDELNVRENIILPLKYSNNTINEEYFNYLVKKLNIEKIIEERVNYLSGGEKQRVSIARALINNPSLIICDEPTGNLDQNNAKSVMDILNSFVNENRTIILVTHSMEIAKQCTKLINLKNGGLYEEKIF